MSASFGYEKKENPLEGEDNEEAHP